MVPDTLQTTTARILSSGTDTLVSCFYSRLGAVVFIATRRLIIYAQLWFIKSNDEEKLPLLAAPWITSLFGGWRKNLALALWGKCSVLSGSYTNLEMEGA